MMSPSQILANEQLCQVAIVVKDINAAGARWAAMLGQEPPKVIETAGLAQARTRYRGQPSQARAKLAFLSKGPIAIELIEPIGDDPSVWRDLLVENGESVHHLAFKVDDLAAALKALSELGHPTVQTGDFAGGSYAYVDTRQVLGVMVELLAFTPK